MRFAALVGMGLLLVVGFSGLAGCGGRPSEATTVPYHFGDRLPKVKGKPGPQAVPPKLKTTTRR
jgi:hypothetical protein